MEKLSKLNIPIIDITEPDWDTPLAKGPKSLYFCVPAATIYAKKKLSPELIRTASHVSEIEKMLSSSPATLEQPSQEEPVAARISSVVVSNRYNPSIKTADVWITTTQLELIRSLFGHGYTIELLSESGTVIKKIES